jgi:hypothetical protein
MTIVVPPRGDRPSQFRRTFVQRIRNAAKRLHFMGCIGPEIAEEIHRALPIEEPRQ